MDDCDQRQPVWRFATLFLWLVVPLILLANVGDYGMSWDEITRWNSGDSKLAYYERVFEDGLSNWGSAGGSDLYPGLFDLPLSIYAKWTGGDRVLAGHLYSIFFAALGVAGAGLMGRELGGWRVAFFASFILALTPRFIGHAVFNPKDIPFAATYSWGVLGVLWCAQSLPATRWRTWLGVGALAGLAMASRLPGVIVLAYLGALVTWRIIARFLKDRSGDRQDLNLRREIVVLIGGFTLAGIVAYAVLMVFFPASHVNPFVSSFSVVERLHTFSNEIPVLFRGSVYEAGSTPWYYVPWMIGITTPLWQLALLIGSVVYSSITIIQRLRAGVLWDLRVVRVGGVLFAFVLPLVYLLVKQPAIHNGVRHFLFVYPAGAALMAFALVAIYRGLGARRRWPRPSFCGLLVVLMLGNGIGLIRLHPFQYIYYNQFVGGPAGSLGVYETDYWFTATPHAYAQLIDWLEAHEHPKENISVSATGPRVVAEHQLPEGWRLANAVDDADYFVGNTQFAGHLLVEGREIESIERLGLPIVLIKKISETQNDKQ